MVDKAAASGHDLIQNHPFVDGDKRTAHAAMDMFLILNGYELRASVDEQETLMLNIASGAVSRAPLAAWIQNHIIAFEQE